MSKFRKSSETLNNPIWISTRRLYDAKLEYTINEYRRTTDLHLKPQNDGLQTLHQAPE